MAEAGLSPGSTATSVTRTSVWAAARLGLTAVTGLAVPPVFVRAYGRAGLGQWAVAAAVAGVIGFLELGLTTSLGRAVPPAGVAVEQDDADAWRATTSYLLLICAATLAGCGAAAALVAGRDRVLAPALLVAAMTVVLMLASVPFVAWLLGRGRPTDAYRPGAAGAALRMAAIVAPPALGASPWWIAAGVLAASVVQLAMTMVAARRAGLPDALTWPGRHLSAARGHVRFGLAASVSTAAELLEQQTDKLLLAGVSGFAPAGVFQAVGSLSVAVRQLGTLLHSYVYSFFVSNRRRDPGPLDHVTRVFTLLTLAAPAAVAAWLFVRAPSFLAWWIHVHDNDAVWGLRFLVAMVLVNLTLGPPVLRLLAAGSVDLVARAAFAALATNLVLSVAAVGPFGLPGVAAASLVGEVAQFAVLALHPASRRYLVAARPAVALVVAVVAAGVAAAALPTPRPSIPVDLATLAAPLGVAAAVLLAWAPRLRRTLAAYDWVL